MELLEHTLRRMTKPRTGRRYALQIEVVDLGEGPAPYMARVVSVESWGFDGSHHHAREILTSSGRSFATITEAVADAEIALHRSDMRSQPYFAKPRT